jgi:hypothetical protein
MQTDVNTLQRDVTFDDDDSGAEYGVEHAP